MEFNLRIWNLLFSNVELTLLEYEIYTLKINMKFSFTIWNLLLKYGFLV